MTRVPALVVIVGAIPVALLAGLGTFLIVFATRPFPKAPR